MSILPRILGLRASGGKARSWFSDIIVLRYALVGMFWFSLRNRTSPGTVPVSLPFVFETQAVDAAPLTASSLCKRSELVELATWVLSS